MFSKIKSDFPSVNQLAWHLRRTTKKLGLWGLIGLAFLMVSFCFYLFFLIPANQQLSRLQNELTYVKKNASVNRQQQISSAGPNASASASANARHLSIVIPAQAGIHGPVHIEPVEMLKPNVKQIKRRS